MSKRTPETVLVGTCIDGLDLSSPRIARAYEIGKKKFEGQYRKSGEPYFTHCVEVARILQKEWGIHNEDVLVSAILHDIVEDTDFTIEDVRREFGDVVVDLVDGVTALSSSDHDAVKKVLGKKTINLGVASIKLADRLHNMRTLGSMPPEKQYKKAKETMEVYTRLAESIGFWNAKIELEDLSFQYIDPENYKIFRSLVDHDPRRQRLFIDHIKSRLEHSFIGLDCNQQVLVVNGGYWAIFDKWQKRAQKGECSPDSLDKIEDVTHVFVVTKDLDSAYLSSGRIREDFRDQLDMDRSHEYIGKTSRLNGYQAIETTIKTDVGDICVSVVTAQMHQYNQFGAVEILNSNEYQNHKHDLIYIFTSAGRIRFLPQGSTGLDFAAQISPDVLISAIGMRVNDDHTSLSSVISNAADVEIITVPTQNTVIEGAELYCTLPQTRELIAKQRIGETRAMKIQEGKQMLEPLITTIGLLDLEDVGPIIKPTLDKLGCSQPSDLYFKIRSGTLSLESVFAELKSAVEKSGLKLTTVRLRGEDHPHILQKLMSVINTTHKNIYNIRLLKNGEKGENFELRVVIQDLETSNQDDFKARVRARFLKSSISVTFAF